MNDCFVSVAVLSTAVIATAAAAADVSFVFIVFIVFESVNVSLSHRNATKNAL